MNKNANPGVVTPRCESCGNDSLVPCFTGQRRAGELLVSTWWCDACGWATNALGREREISKETWDRWSDGHE